LHDSAEKIWIHIEKQAMLGRLK